MKRYPNLEGNSGVVAYEPRPKGIAVQFRGGDVYEYTERSAGADAVDVMRRLATCGRGLSTFIARNHPPYARKLP